jgi:bifunctional DNA-binding transcriptional regulator/antitoxin component of YhaV-PrlF toxin-antitoxin module
MLAKLTAKNQVTLPKRALDALGTPEPPAYFEVVVEEGRIILTPTRIGSADAVRRKLAELGITEADVADAVACRRGYRLRSRSPQNARQPSA